MFAEELLRDDQEFRNETLVEILNRLSSVYLPDLNS